MLLCVFQYVQLIHRTFMNCSMHYPWMLHDNFIKGIGLDCHYQCCLCTFARSSFMTCHMLSVLLKDFQFRKLIHLQSLLIQEKKPNEKPNFRLILKRLYVHFVHIYFILVVDDCWDTLWFSELHMNFPSAFGVFSELVVLGFFI